MAVRVLLLYEVSVDVASDDDVVVLPCDRKGDGGLTESEIRIGLPPGVVELLLDVELR